MAKKRVKDEARELAVAAARVGDDRHCTDVLVLDLRGISPVTDYFVILTGTSNRQLRAVAEEILQAGRQLGRRSLNVAGLDSPQWVLLDFVDVVVHVFDGAYRRFYDLELIWGDAPRVRWRRRAQTGAKADEPRK